jgi:hypothetical protein
MKTWPYNEHLAVICHPEVVKSPQGRFMSIGLQRAKMLMSELGSVLPEELTVSPAEESLWTVRFEDDSALSVQWANTPERLVLSATLGRAQADQQLALYETLLSYNLLWQETGGVRIGMDGPHGELTMVYDFFEDLLPTSTLRTVVLNLANLAHVWRSYVSGNDAPPDFEIDPRTATSFA